MSTINRGEELKRKQKQREIEQQRKIANAYKQKMNKLKKEHEEALKKQETNVLEKMQENKKKANEKLINVLLYTGIYAAIIAGASYLIITYVIVTGFESAIDQQKQLFFAILGAVFGVMITFLLRNQGVELAKQIEESKKVMKEYYTILNKKKSIKKLRTINFYMWVNTIKDIFTKAGTIGVSTYFVLYTFMEGNGDYSLFALAVSNIFMFAGFGFIALAKTYNFYIEQHIPAIKAAIEKMKEKPKETENKDQMGSVPSERT